MILVKSALNTTYKSLYLWHIHGPTSLVQLHIVNIHSDPSSREDIEDSSRGILQDFPGHQNGPSGSRYDGRDRHHGVLHTTLKLNLSSARKVRSRFPHDTQFHFHKGHVHEGDISITLQTSREMNKQ